MHRQALDRDAGQLRPPGQDRADPAQIDAELVLRLAGRNTGVGARVHVRVEAQRDRGRHPLVARDPGQQLQLRQAFDVELQDPGVQAEGHLPGGLADPGEDDLVGRHAGRQRPAQLALGDHVGAGAQAREAAHHRQIGIGLERVADQRRQVGDGAREGAVGRLQSAAAVAVERRADRRGQRVERDVLGVQPAVAVVKPSLGRHHRIGGHGIGPES